MTGQESKELILRKMKAKEIPIRSRVSDEKHASVKVYESIHIANYLPELNN